MRGLVLVLALTSLTAAAKRPPQEAQTPVVVPLEDFKARLDRANDLLSESIGQAGKNGKLKKKLEAARDEVRALREMMGRAPTSKAVEESTQAGLGMVGGIMKMGEEQMRLDREERNRRDRDDRHDGRGHTKVVVVHQQPVEPPPPAIVAMESGAFEALSKAVAREGFEDGKLQVVASAASENHFSVAQVHALLRQFPFAEGRLGAARALKSRIVDPKNNFQLYSAFDFEDDKAQLRAILSQ